MALRFPGLTQASFADKSAARLHQDTSCPDCGLDDALVEDHRQGAVICQRCGVWVEQGARARAPPSRRLSLSFS